MVSTRAYIKSLEQVEREAIEAERLRITRAIADFFQYEAYDSFDFGKAMGYARSMYTEDLGNGWGVGFALGDYLINQYEGRTGK